MLLCKIIPLALLVGLVSSFCAKDPVKEAAEEGKIALVMLLKGSCPYCQTQAAKLYRWYSLLEDFQDDFKIIFVNQKGYDKYMYKLKAITYNDFAYHQDTEGLDIWKNFNVNGGRGGNKDDVFFFDLQGRMVYVPSSGRENSDMGAKDALCEEKDDIATIKTLLKLISEKRDDGDDGTEVKACNDDNDLDFDEIFQRRALKPKKSKEEKEKLKKMRKENRLAKKEERQKNRKSKKEKKEKKQEKKEEKKEKKKEKKEEKKEKKKERKEEKQTKKEKKEEKRTKKEDRKAKRKQNKNKDAGRN